MFGVALGGDVDLSGGGDEFTGAADALSCCMVRSGDVLSHRCRRWPAPGAFDFIRRPELVTIGAMCCS